MRLPAKARLLLVVPALFCAVLAGGAVRVIQDTCGPFTDVSALFCPYVLEAYYTGITAGTSATTFSPDIPITRGQAAVFVTKGLNQALARGSRRAALGWWWRPQNTENLTLSPVGSLALGVASDGTDIWATAGGDSTVVRVRSSDGKILEAWTNATNALAVTAAMGRVFFTRNYPPASLYMIDPTQPAGDAVAVSADLGLGANGLAFDGGRFWVSTGGPIQIITPGASLPWPVTQLEVSAGYGFVFDGGNMWVTQKRTLLKFDAAGSVIQTVVLSGDPGYPVFDGANIWVPVQNPDGVDIVQASTGSVLTTLSGNGLVTPWAAAFDGERVLVTTSYSNLVSLWRAADLAPLGSLSTGPFSVPLGVCSDGTNFWIALNGSAAIARF